MDSTKGRRIFESCHAGVLGLMLFRDIVYVRADCKLEKMTQQDGSPSHPRLLMKQRVYLPSPKLPSIIVPLGIVLLQEISKCDVMLEVRGHLKVPVL